MRIYCFGMNFVFVIVIIFAGMVSSRLVLRWKEIGIGYKAKARWCVHGFKDRDIHEI